MEATEPNKEEPRPDLMAQWFDDVHRAFTDKPIFMLLRVELKEVAGRTQRVVSLEGAAPTKENIEFILDSQNPISY